MLVQYHVAASTAVASGLLLASGSWQMAAASLVSGILVDADHTVEYAVEHGLSLDVRRFLRLVFQARYKRVFYLLHAWEWLLVAVPAVWATGYNPWGLGLLVGYVQHLALDQMGNRGTPWSYFFIWRWRQGFDHGRCFPGFAHRLNGPDDGTGVR